VPCTDPSDYTKGLSLYEHKIIKKINREIIRESKDVLGLAKARMAIYDRVKEEQEAIRVLADNSKAEKRIDEKTILEDWDDDLEAFE